MPSFSSGRALIAAVMERYRALSAYSDVGQVSTRLRNGEHVLTFETTADAGGNFRFTFQSPHPYWPLRHKVTTHIVGRAQGQSYLYSLTSSGQARLENIAELRSGVAAATGISAGAAHTIAGLLYADVGGWTFANLKRPRRRAPRVVDGVLCHRITGLQGRTPVVVYVGVEDLLLRKFADRKSRAVEVRRHVDVDRARPPEHFEMPGSNKG